MEISNTLKRTKIKLKLFEQEGFYSLLLDLIQNVDPNKEKSEHIMEIQKLRHSYLRYIQENEPKDLKQLEIKLI